MHNQLHLPLARGLLIFDIINHVRIAAANFRRILIPFIVLRVRCCFRRLLHIFATMCHVLVALILTSILIECITAVLNRVLILYTCVA